MMAWKSWEVNILYWGGVAPFLFRVHSVSYCFPEGTMLAIFYVGGRVGIFYSDGTGRTLFNLGGTAWVFFFRGHSAGIFNAEGKM